MTLIKLTLQGFCSFRERTEIHFDRSSNKIIGRNRTGKSSLLKAIQFVIGRISVAKLAIDSERTIFVELVFDNSDRQLPVLVSGSETSLKRQINEQGVDRYYLNGRLLADQQLFNVLNYVSVQFPNYVDGSLINELASSALDGQTTLYANVMKTAIGLERNEIEEIDEIVESISSKNRTLNTDLERIENNTSRFLSDNERIVRSLDYLKRERYLKYRLAERNRVKINEQVDCIRIELERLKRDREVAEEEIRRLKSTAAEQQPSADDFYEGSAGCRLATARNTVDVFESIIENCLNDARKFKIRESEAIRRKKLLREELTERKRCGEAKRIEYRTKCALADRLKWALRRYAELRSNDTGRGPLHRTTVLAELRELNAYAARKRATIDDCQAIRQSIFEAVRTTARQEVDRRRENFYAAKEAIGSADLDLFIGKANLRNYLNELTPVDEEYRCLKLRETILKTRLNDAAIEVTKTFGKDMFREAAIIEKLTKTIAVSDGRPQLYHGRLIDVISFDRRLGNSVAAEAGEYLYDHVVEDREVAVKCVRELLRQRQSSGDDYSGNIRFIALRNLKSPAIDVDETVDVNVNENVDVDETAGSPNSGRAKSTVSQLTYARYFESAVRFAFQRPVLLDECEQVIECNDYDSPARRTVIVEGEQIFSEGGAVLIDASSTVKTGNLKIDVYRRYQQRKNALASCEERLESLERKLSSSLAEELFIGRDGFDSVIAEPARLGITLLPLRRLLKYRAEMLLATRKHARSLSDSCFQISLNRCKTDMESVDGACDRLKNELEIGQMSTADADSDALRNDIDALKAELRTTEENEGDGDFYLCALRDEVNALDTKTAILTEMIDDESGEINIYARQLNGCVDKEGHYRTKLMEARIKCEQLTDTLKSRDDVDDVSRDDGSALSRLTEKESQLERFNERCSELSLDLFTLRRKLDECETERLKLKPLVTVVDAFDHYESYDVDQLLAELEALNRERGKRPVYANVSAEHDALMRYQRRKVNLFAGKVSLNDTYANLVECVNELRKTVALVLKHKFDKVNRTFSDMSRTVFGNAAVNTATTAHDGVTECRLVASPDVEWIDIEVSFAENSGRSASDKERNLLALIFLLAVNVDSDVSYCLFDEVDRAVPANYVGRVSQLLREISRREHTQLICAIFSASLLWKEDRIFRIKLDDRTSCVDSVTKENAAEFLHNFTCDDSPI